MKNSFKTLCWVILFSAMEVQATDFRNVALQKTIDEPGPLKGIVLWADNSQMNALKNSIALEFLYYQPCKVITGKSDGALQYDWSSFDAKLDDAKSRGHQTIVRFYFEYPGTSGTITGASGTCTCNVAGATAVPLYIKNRNDYHETYEHTAEFDGGDVYYADWSNAELQWFAKQFYTDLAARYDNDSRVAYIQVGFGYWGEYHIYGAGNTNLGVNFPSKTYQTEFLQHINTLFTKTPWSMSKDVSDSDYSPVYGNNTLMNLHFGVFDDSFMHATHDMPSGCTLPWNCGDKGYNQYHINGLGTNRWQTAPFGGEISYYTANDQKNFLKPTGMYGATFEQRAAQYHVSYMVGNDATSGSYATAARVKEAGIATGYRFEITQYQVSDTEAKVKVKNFGVAPLYHDAYVTVKGVRSAASLKGLLPNAEQEYTVNGLSIGTAENPDVTITSDKVLSGKTIPYQADLQASPTGIADVPATNSNIRQENNRLFFSGEGFSVTLYDLAGVQVFFTQESSANIAPLSVGIYLVRYVAKDGSTEIKKIWKK